MSLLMTKVVFIIVMDLLHDSYDRYPFHDTFCPQAFHLYHVISFQKHQKDNKLDGKKKPKDGQVDGYTY